MELKQIKELMAAMGRTGMKKLLIKKEGGFELQLEREENSSIRGGDVSLDIPDENPMRNDIEMHRASASPSRNTEKRTLIPGQEDNTKPPTDELPGQYVTSPMVGTFYASPSPDDPPFVKIGDKVDKNTVICIIEAMKVMNEVKAYMTGTVAEILVETGHPVEFGTKLIKIL